MIEWIRYRILMRRLRGEIACLAQDRKREQTGFAPEKSKSSLTACNACGSIV